MENLTVEQLEELIVLAENKLGTMRPTDEGYVKEMKLIGQLRDMRQAKLYGEA
jgi:RNase P subunit RPR2